MTTKTNKPLPLEVKIGQRYSWCSCGFSQNMPLCDHSHREKSTKKSEKFYAGNTGTLHLCGCANTRTPPYCDNQQCKS